MAKIIQFHPYLTLKHQFMRSGLTLLYVFMYITLPAKYARYCKLNQPSAFSYGKMTRKSLLNTWSP
jgi:hypothetical protein